MPDPQYAGAEPTGFDASGAPLAKGAADLVLLAGGLERARISATGVGTGLFAGAQGITGAALNGTTDDSAALTAAFTQPGAYVVPAGKTLAIANTITLLQDRWLLLAPGATVKWIGGNSTNMFTQSIAAGPNIRCGVLGWGGIGLDDDGNHVRHFIDRLAPDANLEVSHDRIVLDGETVWEKAGGPPPAAVE